MTRSGLARSRPAGHAGQARNARLTPARRRRPCRGSMIEINRRAGAGRRISAQGVAAPPLLPHLLSVIADITLKGSAEVANEWGRRNSLLRRENSLQAAQ